MSSDLVVGLVGAVGSDLPEVERAVQEQLAQLRYRAEVVKLSVLLHDIPRWKSLASVQRGDDRIRLHMDAGDNLRATLERRDFDLLFGNPFHAPHPEEFGMFLAQAAARRSSSLSRQVGAVITTRNGEVIATGTNEVPHVAGGLSWPGLEPDDRDVVTGYEPNDQMKRYILADVLKRLREAGWIFRDAEEIRTFVDEAIAGDKARRVDVVVVAAFDRFGRSVRHLVEHLDLFRHLGVEFISLREQIDTGSPLGAAVFTIIAAIAQLERSLIMERVKAGLRRARAEGRQLGRPRLQVDPSRVERVVARGLSVRAAAKELGVSPASYLRLARSAPSCALPG